MGVRCTSWCSRDAHRPASISAGAATSCGFTARSAVAQEPLGAWRGATPGAQVPGSGAGPCAFSHARPRPLLGSLPSNYPCRKAQAAARRGCGHWTSLGGLWRRRLAQRTGIAKLRCPSISPVSGVGCPVSALVREHEGYAEPPVHPARCLQKRPVLVLGEHHPGRVLLRGLSEPLSSPLARSGWPRSSPQPRGPIQNRDQELEVVFGPFGRYGCRHTARPITAKSVILPHDREDRVPTDDPSRHHADG